MRKFAIACSVIAAMGLLTSTLSLPTQASRALGGVVSQDPADFTPNVEDDATVPHTAIYALHQVGKLMYAGGTFHMVTDASRTTTYLRDNIMAFNRATGNMSTAFVPVVNGPVWAIASRGSSLFIGGDFTRVNGVPRHGLAKIDVLTGAVDPVFRSHFTKGVVTSLRICRGHLVASGSFAKQLASLNRRSGADDGWLKLRISGTVSTKAGPTEVYRFSVNPEQTRLVAIGNFTSVNGSVRYRAFMVRLGMSSTSLAVWSYPGFAHRCTSRKMADYLRGVDYSPDGSYFVIVATGFVPRTPARIGTDVCDAAARFNAGAPHPTTPVWINYTGGDTLHSVAVTDKAVYVQGHPRWLNNPQGRNSKGPGAVDRLGIGAIIPATGKALAWNPGKTRGVGGRVLYVTSHGLWVGSDGKRFAGEYRNNLAFLPI